MAYTKYSLTPANNNATPPDGAPEGMLPSAVNDTMRDMMAQIRDCGDGIRDGTYTMTAPKITGGTITGAAFTGNTFTSPVITGGSINNTPIGGTTANSGAFTTLSASGVATFSAGTVSAPAITTSGDTNTGIFFPAADTIAFTKGGVESMRIDSSGNVGIGTSSPLCRLDVASGTNPIARIRNTTGGGAAVLFQNTDTGTTDTDGVFVGMDGGEAGYLWNYENNVLLFGTNNTERMRIDSSGRGWIGTTATYLGNSTLDQVGVQRPFNIYGSDSSTTIAGSQASLTIANIDTTTNNTAQLTFAAITGANTNFYASGAINCVFGARTNAQYPTGQLVFSTSSALNSAPTEKMRITSGGNVGIGNSSPNNTLSIQAGTASVRLDSSTGTNAVYSQFVNTGGSFYVGRDNSTGAVFGAAYASVLFSEGAYPMNFYTAGTERMRITSDGELLVGKTSANTASGTGCEIRGTGTIAVVAPSTLGDTYDYYNSTAGAYRFYVTNAGVINATSTTITAISDQRLKENIRDLDVGLTEIMAIKPRRFDWKEGRGLDKKDDVGFIAQEFETVFPNSVTLSKAGEDGVEYKSVSQSELIPTLVKAIQEQQAMIEELKQEVALLKSK